MVRATREVPAGAEVLISYGERADRHFCLFFGFLPDPNPANTVALFGGLEEAADWYEQLCDGGRGLHSSTSLLNLSRFYH